MDKDVNKEAGIAIFTGLEQEEKESGKDWDGATGELGGKVSKYDVLDKKWSTMVNASGRPSGMSMETGLLCLVQCRPQFLL